MDARLDPACAAARALARQQDDSDALLVGGSAGQLAAVVKATHAKQVTDHLVRCARCRHYDPRCAACGFDARRERHGWMCPQQASRWRDLLPWNWRPKRAPAAAAAWPARYDQAAPGSAGPDLAPPGSTCTDLAAPGSARPDRAPPGPSRSAPAAPAAAPRAASAAAAPKPRPRPRAPAADALAVAYAALGLATDASQDAVRAAYRARAQQYHPDKVAHLAPEFRDVAERKMLEINSAYERIKRSWPAP